MSDADFIQKAPDSLLRRASLEKQVKLPALKRRTNAQIRNSPPKAATSHRPFAQLSHNCDRHVIGLEIRLNGDAGNQLT